MTMKPIRTIWTSPGLKNMEEQARPAERQSRKRGTAAITKQSLLKKGT
jgi:hypothetical protein